MQNKKTILKVIIVAISLTLLISLAFLTTYTGPGPVEIEITSDKPSYLLGENITFSIYVNNPHDWQVEKPSQIICTLANMSRVSNVDYAYRVVFPAHSRTYLDMYWWDQREGLAGNRTLVQPGNYTLTVSLGGPVDYGEPGNCTVTIKPAQ